jgi:LPS sulfotransferase NodH
MSARTGKFDPNAATGRLELMLEEEVVRARVGSGYNPYETVPNVGKPGEPKRYSDLRQLSEWIRLKRQMAKQVADEGKPEAARKDKP